jgi:hypothetical protein
MHPVFFVLDTNLLRAISLIFFFPFDGNDVQGHRKHQTKSAFSWLFMSDELSSM